MDAERSSLLPAERRSGWAYLRRVGRLGVGPLATTGGQIAGGLGVTAFTVWAFVEHIDPLTAITVVFFIVLAVGAIGSYRVWQETEADRSSLALGAAARPSARLHFGPPESDLKALENSVGSQLGIGSWLLFAIANVPESPETAQSADAAHAEFTIWTEDGKYARSPIRARWQGSPQATDRGRFEPTNTPELSERVIPANGRRYYLDSLVYVVGQGFYIWNDDSMVATEFGLSSNWEVDGAQVIVHMVVRAAGTEAVSQTVRAWPSGEHGDNFALTLEVLEPRPE